MAASSINHEDLVSFAEHLQQSSNILALCGAGLSAASGLPTFRGAGGLWRNHDAIDLATPEAFAVNPGLVWQFYSYRRHMALSAKPNPAHYALAELARRKETFITLTQNVDGKLASRLLWKFSLTTAGLSPRANHPASQLYELHGSLFEVKCSSYCDYHEYQNFTDPIVPALALPKGAVQPAPLGTSTSGAAATSSIAAAMQGARAEQPSSQELDISDSRVEIPILKETDLPTCPKCDRLLRPGVVWFGEPLPSKTMDEIDAFIEKAEKIDLILVIGTSSKVYPAAGYVPTAREKGARVAVVNMDENDVGDSGLQPGDWLFRGDAALIVPALLKGETGDLSDAMHDVG